MVLENGIHRKKETKNDQIQNNEPFDRRESRRQRRADARYRILLNDRR